MLGRVRQTPARSVVATAVALAAGLTLVLTSCGGGSANQSVVTVQSVRTVTTVAVKPFAPRAATESDLKTISGVLGQPIYWAGPKPRYTYEIRQGQDGSTFVRYLPPGTPVGAKGLSSAPFLFIATYPLSDAYAAIVRASKRKGSVAVKIPNKGLAVYATKRPARYYFAYPGSKYQVGVFAPNAKVARKLVLGAQVVPVS
jgi:hypothetical protein